MSIASRRDRCVSKSQVFGTVKTRNFGAPAILVPVWVVLWHPKGYQNRWFSEWHDLGTFKTRNFGAPAILVPVWVFPISHGRPRLRGKDVRVKKLNSPAPRATGRVCSAPDARPNICRDVHGISLPKTFCLGCFSVPDPNFLPDKRLGN